MATAKAPVMAQTVEVLQAQLSALVQERDGLQADLLDARRARDEAVGNEAETAAAIVRELPPYGSADRQQSVVALLSEASGLVGAIPKGETMKGREGYQYRGIEQITERAQPIFAKLGLVLVPYRVTRLEFEAVTNQNNTRGRHYLVTLLWRVYGPAGDFIELETPGECAEWGGDKGGNKAFTGARKNALTAALNLADRTFDPDDYQPEASVHRAGGAETPAAAPAQEPEPYLAPEAWRAWADVRAALRGTSEGKAFAAWCEDQGFDLTRVNYLTQRQGDAMEAKARELELALRARNANKPEPEQQVVDPHDTGDDAERATGPVPERQQTITELRDSIAGVGKDGQGPATPAVAPAGGPVGVWQCNRCGVDVQGELGATCAVCGKGELADLRGEGEPF